MVLLVLSGCRKNIVYDQREGELADMSWYQIEDGSFYYADIDKFKSLFADKKTTIIYIGYEECPWCRELCPVLDEYLQDYEFKAYYYDIQIGENGSTENLTEIEQLLLDKLEKDEDGKQYSILLPLYIFSRERFTGCMKALLTRTMPVRER